MSAAHIALVASAVTESQVASRKTTEMKDFLHGGPRKPQPKYINETIREQTRAMMASGDFSQACAVHFLALHDELHRKVYGVGDPDLTGGMPVNRARQQAQGLLSAMGADALVKFVRWAWQDEKRCEDWRR